MNEMLAIGLILGVLVGLGLVVFILKTTKTDGSIDCKYDERQELARGKGFKLAFFVLLLYNAFFAGMTICLEKTFISPDTAAILGICIGIAAYVGYCIWNDAYFALNENRSRLVVAFTIAFLANLLLGIVGVYQGEIIKEGVLTFRSTNFMVAGLGLFVAVMCLLKNIRDKKEVQG